MSESSRKLFNANKQVKENTGIINVLVSLKGPADENCLQDLENIGLKVNTANGNKLVGEINNSLLPILKNHLQVIEVETSVKLNPNDSKLRD